MGRLCLAECGRTEIQWNNYVFFKNNYRMCVVLCVLVFFVFLDVKFFSVHVLHVFLWVTFGWPSQCQMEVESEW